MDKNGIVVWYEDQCMTKINQEIVMQCIYTNK